MSRLSVWLILVGVGCVSVIARADLREDMQRASAKLEPVLQNAEDVAAAGGIDEVNRKILATFPEKTRTAAEAFLLANVLFHQNPQASYALHKRAAAEFPDESMAQLEWALEQHRAGQYAAAVETYAKVVKAMPEFGPVLGMQAECLIRTGQTKAAVDAWLKSETGNGSLQQLESWVCEVHTHEQPDHDRADLFAKTKNGDIAAAEKLVALDGDFPRDWWNGGPKQSYLEKDLELLDAGHFKDPGRLREIRCAAQCGIIRAKDDGDVAKVLHDAGFLLDDHATLPAGGKLLSQMLSAAYSRKAISRADATKKFGEAVLARAKATGDAEMFNVAAHLYIGTDRLAEIDQLGWDVTGQSRFAASLLVGLAGKGNLKLDDPRLVKAAAQFPESSDIARIIVTLTKQAGQPMQAVLVSAIKAEYSHFSVGGLIELRPSASGLRAYFSELSKEMNVKVVEGGDAALHIGAAHLVGSELRVIIETSRTYRPPFTSSSRTADAKGWLVTVDTAKQSPLAQRSRVIGPLWDVPNPRSTISFQAGAMYSKEDTDAASATPAVMFASDGALLRLTRQGNGKMLREKLAMTADAASWVREAEFATIDDYITWPSEDQTTSASGRYHLQRKQGKVTLYDLSSGKAVDDPWLQKVYAQYRDINALQNVVTWLTDDLQYLICNPASIWNDGKQTIHKTFEVAGKAYDRVGYGLIWARPSESPVVFKKEPSAGFSLFNGPASAITIGGKLYLYYHDKAHLRLIPMAGGPTLEAPVPTEPEWEWASTVQHDEPTHRLIFTGGDFMTRHDLEKESTIIYVWNYQARKVTRAEARTPDLFEKKGSRYEPRISITPK